VSSNLTSPLERASSSSTVSGLVWIYTEGHADWELVPASQRSKGR
jgi:hypothetical protein